MNSHRKCNGSFPEHLGRSPIVEAQHIPNTGEHLTRYYGYYSNKARGLRAKRAVPAPDAQPGGEGHAPDIPGPVRLDHRRWAMLIKRIYQADPLRCPKCGGTMRIIALIEAHQGDVIRKILQHCGLWKDPPPRGPPRISRPPPAVRPTPEADGGITYEVDPDFLEHVRREACRQPELPWDD